MTSADHQAALVNVRKAAQITNKVLKNGAVQKMEDCLDGGKSVGHDKMAGDIEAACEDPSKVGLKVSSANVESCYFPIVQSGGVYDIKPSAQTNEDKLSDDVMILGLGVRYKGYCANVARTFFVDPVAKCEADYKVLLEVRDLCLAKMVPGVPVKGVAEAAVALLKEKDPALAAYVPKNFGFGLGLDFREAALILNDKCDKTFEKGMIFNLAVGLHNVPLSPDDVKAAKGTIRKRSKYSMLVADTVAVGDPARAEVLTKHGATWGDVSYFINEEGGEDEEDDEDGGRQEAADAAMAKKLQGAAGQGAIRGSRLRERPDQETVDAVGARDEKQAALMRRKLAEKKRGKTKSKGGGEDGAATTAGAEVAIFKATRDYPPEVPTKEIYVDMDSQVVFVPIDGAPVPFHISMIKNVVQPEADRAASYLRLNFYVPGQSMGKDVPPETVALMERSGKTDVFVKELLYRSREGRKLTQAFRMIQELRKRHRQSAQMAAEEADLVAQDKLVKMRDQKVPRMADLTMRPFASGKKSTGTLEAHTNGLRFVSKKNEVVDVMYANVKHALFQPCENEVMVLIHFNLKNPIMIGKKKSKDVQFFTEVIDASVALDASKRSMYDPDELDDEQRERSLRKKLNEMFKEFCKKLERVAKHHNFDLEFDIPYRDLGFHGVPHREMVLVQPTVHCLVNLTETPFLIIELDDVEHVHFERCTLRSTNVDMVVIHKNFELMPLSINAVPIGELDQIQEWLTDCSITYTAGPASFAWKSIMATVRSFGDTFYDDKDENGDEKDPGWSFLSMGDDEEEGDDEEGDDDYEEDSSAEEESSSEEEEDDDDDDSEDDEDEDEDEEGLDWDDFEKQAPADEGDEGGDRPKKKPKKR